MAHTDQYVGLLGFTVPVTASETAGMDTLTIYTARRD
jgi:hypothetical protein